MSRSRARLAADWFAKLRQNAVTQEVEHTDVVAASETVSHIPTLITASLLTTTVDLSLGTNSVVSMTSSTVFLFTNLVAGTTGVIFLKQDALGGRTFTLPSTAKTPLGGAAIVQSTASNSMAILSYTVVDASTVLVNYIGGY